MNGKIREKHDAVCIITDLCRKVCVSLLPFTGSTELHRLSLSLGVLQAFMACGRLLCYIKQVKEVS